MDKQTKNKIKSMVLALRQDFEKEIANRLNNIGISPDREWKDGRSLPHLSEDEIGRNELEKRRRIAAFITREIKAGQGQKAATEEFIREASYTWINRLIGLKCLESQDLIEEVITTRPEYGNRSKQHRDFRERNPEAASRPDDGLIGCLFSAFEAITEEIRVLFDPKDEYSLIIPRYPVLKNAIEKINTELDYETYQADDFLGWVYQYFNSKEKDRVFEEVKTKKKKIAGNDIINATQLYTEKYMVHFLVENSLGAMWMEMYPDSPLSSRWEYFVKDPNNTTRETKPVKEIKFLDPACGSGHFLLYAFDLFYAMYEEEGIIPRNQIPEFILKNNLHGIDIDQRAIQLSALGLYMKAKSKNPYMKVQQMNLVSANAVMLNSDILEEFLQDFKDDKIAQELITTIWHGLANLRELGSLLKIEEQIDEVIEKRSGERLDLFVEGKAKSWEQWRFNLTKAIRKYYKIVSQNIDINKQLFASEAYKGVQFLDLLEQRFDVVATNPPYMSNKNMGNNLKQYLQLMYPNNNSDLYQAFIVRCIKLNKSNGYFSMICQKSFLFLNSFVSTRNLILDTCQIRTLALLGSGAFEDIGGEVVNTAMFSLKKSTHNEYDSIFLDVSSEKNKGLKINECLLSAQVYSVNQTAFHLIKDHPFVFWIKDFDKLIFKNYKSLDDKTKNSYATPRQG
ncbi:Eco57I restriction-modification methylase domain-containing protein, partial [Methanosarcina mazei]|uniref:Eco57I restriction-modification methylase domain-containing protein n=1 Tax=Methanosarcina mazei TaxID=2209 RepID=UPI001C30C215